MKKLFQFVIILLIAGSIPFAANAQCKNFAKKVCKLELLPYVHDGIYNATVLSEGETAELFKTFYSGQEYRITICNAKELPGIQFKVMDTERNVLFDSKKNKDAKKWDFSLKASQQLIISIEVPTSEDFTDDLKSGCVAVLVGFLNVESSFENY